MILTENNRLNNRYIEWEQSNKYVTVTKLLKTVSLSDFDVVNFSK